jgi:GT2 family glycosyltransferase
MARCAEIVHLDDDTVLPTQGILHAALDDLGTDGIAAVAMPYQNVNLSQEVLSHSPNVDGVALTYAFTACAYAIKQQPFVAVGGYREFFFYMGEESDLCIRLAAENLGTRLGTGPSVHHLQPAGRISAAADFYGRRNEVLFEVLNAPASLVVPALMRVSTKAVVYGIRCRRLGIMLHGLMAGYREGAKRRNLRQPVPLNVYQRFRRLVKDRT